VFLKKFDFDPDPEMDPVPDPDPELSEKSVPDPEPDPEIIFSAPTHCLRIQILLFKINIYNHLERAVLVTVQSIGIFQR